MCRVAGNSQGASERPEPAMPKPSARRRAVGDRSRRRLGGTRGGRPRTPARGLRRAHEVRVCGTRRDVRAPNHRHAALRQRQPESRGAACGNRGGCHAARRRGSAPLASRTAPGRGRRSRAPHFTVRPTDAFAGSGTAWEIEAPTCRAPRAPCAKPGPRRAAADNLIPSRRRSRGELAQRSGSRVAGSSGSARGERFPST